MATAAKEASKEVSASFSSGSNQGKTEAEKQQLRIDYARNKLLRAKARFIQSRDAYRDGNYDVKETFDRQQNEYKLAIDKYEAASSEKKEPIPRNNSSSALVATLAAHSPTPSAARAVTAH